MTKELPPTFRVSTPGRLCLFGEHQDYLDLPVIPCAISLRISLEGKRRNDPIINLALPDISSTIKFSLNQPIAYASRRDYFRSSVNVLRRAGLTFSNGFDCTLSGKIPINAGASSSSALVVTWINFLAYMSDQQVKLSNEEISRFSYLAEVVEFNEPGGMMDHYCTSIGGIIFLEFHPAVRIERLQTPLRAFVLGNSGEVKNTKIILSRVKNRVLNLVKILSRVQPEFSLLKTPIRNIERYTRDLGKDEKNLLLGTIRNRDITREALTLFHHPEFDEQKFGNLLNEHHSILRDVLKISTVKIDKMIDAAMNTGAYGGKINGSGGGGCMFAYAPERTEAVAEAIEKAGGRAYIVNVDTGTRLELPESI